MKTFPRALAIGISVIAFSFACTCTGSAQAPLVFAQFSPNLVQTPQPRELSLADRVAYQYAIEEVYWRHRIWPKERPDSKPSLDEAMPPAQLELKVRDYLRDSQALEDYWQQPVRAEQLQAEMERMAQHTAQPDVLRELFAALGNNPLSSRSVWPGRRCRSVCWRAYVRTTQGAKSHSGPGELEWKTRCRIV